MAEARRRRTRLPASHHDSSNPDAAFCDSSSHTRGSRGGAPDGNAIPISKDLSEAAMDSAACIGCGACVAACKNAAAHLFTSAKMAHLGRLPQGQAERYRRVIRMVDQMDAEGFGMCSNEGECEAVCPKEIPISNIARMNRDYVRAMWKAGR